MMIIWDFVSRVDLMLSLKNRTGLSEYHIHTIYIIQISNVCNKQYICTTQFIVYNIHLTRLC